MTNESRATFEAWLKTEYKPGCAMLMTDSDGDYMNAWTMREWSAWQASRKEALEEAAELCHCISLQRNAGPMECEVRIRKMK